MAELIKNLKQNKIYAFIALAIVLIATGAILFRALKKPLPENNLSLTRNNSAVESLTGVYLEQKEYKSGENIIGAIRNSEDFDITVTNIAIERLFINQCDESIGDVSIKNQCEQSEWKAVKYDIGCRGCALGITSVKCERANIGVRSHNIYEFNWDRSTDDVEISTGASKEDEKPACKMAGAGTYRVKVGYYGKAGDLGISRPAKIIYSKEFTINDNPQTMKIESSAFGSNQLIPEKYTCQGADINPPLKISGVPQEAKSLALIVDDLDAPMGVWTHWTAWNIAPTTTEITENSVPVGAREGATNFSKPGYGGPCPPSGTHRYFFKLYALDSSLNLSSSATKADLEKAIQGHILAQSELIGLYKNQ